MWYRRKERKRKEQKKSALWALITKHTTAAVGDIKANLKKTGVEMSISSNYRLVGEGMSWTQELEGNGLHTNPKLERRRHIPRFKERLRKREWT